MPARSLCAPPSPAASAARRASAGVAVSLTLAALAGWAGGCAQYALAVLALAAGTAVLGYASWCAHVAVGHPTTPREDVVLMVVLGAGGHTAELLPLVKALLDGRGSKRYESRHYVHADTDTIAVRRAQVVEDSTTHGTARFHAIPRAREVGQSYLTSVGTTLKGIAAAVRLLALHPPDLLLCNGPGTCLPVVLAAALVRIGAIGRTARRGGKRAAARVVYVESAARVQHLSLTGKILKGLKLADALYVQWERLADPANDVWYAGRLV